MGPGHSTVLDRNLKCCFWDLLELLHQLGGVTPLITTGRTPDILSKTALRLLLLLCTTVVYS